MSAKHKSAGGAIIGIVLLFAVILLRIWPGGGNDGNDVGKQPAGQDAAAQQRNAQDSSDQRQYRRVFTAKVQWVPDGDTIHCREAGDEVRIRLFGIDSPEIDQPGYEAARDALRRAVDDQTVEIRVVDVDQYDRLVARVILPGRGNANEIDVNRQQVLDGMAWWYRTFAPDEDDLKSAEQSARSARRGLWREDDPLPPWEFRRRAREAGR